MLSRLSSPASGVPAPGVTSCGTSKILFLESNMTKTLKKKRHNAATRQDFRCYYCGLPMWEKDPHSFAEQYILTSKQAQLLLCTAEHLRARSDGGSDGDENIAAACQFCNKHRHIGKSPKPPEQFRVYVHARMQKGAWLVPLLPMTLIGSSRK